MKRRRICSLLLTCCMLRTAFPAILPVSGAARSAAYAAEAVTAAETTAETASTDEITTTTETTFTDETTTAAETTYDEATTTTETTYDEATTATETTYDETTTTTETTYDETTTTETTMTEPAAEFSAEIAPCYPGGLTSFTLSLKENPGLEALGLQIRLPAELTPLVYGGDASATFGEALDGESLYWFYNAEKRLLSLSFAADQPGAAEELLLTVPLAVATKAEIGTTYLCTVQIDSAAPAAAPEEPLTVPFTAQEPLLRACPEALTLTGQGETAALLLDPLPRAGACQWTSGDTEVVTVDENGTLTAVGNGKTEITVLCETRTYICAVTVDIARSIAPESPEITEKYGSLALSLTPAAVHAVTWQSSDESVAVIAADGTVTAKANGTVEITAQCEGITYSAQLRVHYPCTLNYTGYAAKETGDTVQLILQDAPAGAELHWESADDKVAAVSAEGLVTFTGTGETEITVTLGEERYVCTAVNLPYLRGDANLDGMVDAKDANRLLMHINLVEVLDAESPLEPLAIRAGDADLDGRVTLRDTAAILYYFGFSVIGEDPDWDRALAILS